MIMRDKIFLQTQIVCNIKNAESTSLGEKYGSMTVDQFKMQFNTIKKIHQFNTQIREKINF